MIKTDIKNLLFNSNNKLNASASKRIWWQQNPKQRLSRILNNYDIHLTKLRYKTVWVY
jgi:hypothetical protein